MVSARYRILFVAKNLQQGGTERQLLRMMKALDPERFEVALCVLAPERHYDELPVGEPRYAFDVPPRDMPAVISECIDDFLPDVVHSFRDGVNRQVHEALAISHHQPSWLASVRGRPMLPADLLGTFRFFRRAYRITVNSVGIRQTLRMFALVPARKIVVIPNLIDADDISPPTSRERREARASFDLPESGFVWVLPGRLSWVKNQLGLVMALALLKMVRALPRETTFLLAGRVRDRMAAWLINPIARLLGVAKHLRYVGSRKDVRSLYAAADALVLPSWAEGMPNVVLEAQLAGLPAVVTGQANRDGLVEAGETGFVSMTGSPFALARALVRLMRLPLMARRRMGQLGRTRLRERFARRPIVDALERLYEAAALARRGPGAQAVVSREVVRRAVSGGRPSVTD